MAVNSQVKEITERLEQGVKGVFASESYADYLKVMSRFHGYSTRNTILIHMQMPDASRVAGFRAWQEKFKRQVKKGEKSIKILAPAPYVIQEEREQIDPESDMPVIGEDGMPIIELTARQLARFKVASVFDISQTEGEPLLSLVHDLAGDVQQYEAFLEALQTISPLPIVFEALDDGADGWCVFGDKIYINTGMSEIQTVSAVIHEITHAKLHDRSLEAATMVAPRNRRKEEVEAESVSYAVCQYFGIETSANSFGYLAEWSKNSETKELMASLDTIRKTASELIGEIEGKFREITKERNITIDTTEEQTMSEERGSNAIGLSVDEQEPINILTEYSNLRRDYTVGSNVLLKPLFNEGNFNRAGKKIRVTVEEPVGKYSLFSREEHGDKVLYFMTASGRIDQTAWHFRSDWDDELHKWVNHRPSEADFDELIPKVAEQFEQAMADPEKWAKYQHAAVVNRIADCEAHNIPVREKQTEVERQRKENAEKKRQEGLRQAQEKYDARIDEIALAIQKGETIPVRYDKNEFGGKNPVLDLFKLYGVNLPLRTQGWVNTGLAELSEGGYRYYSSTHKGNSTTFRNYFAALKAAIQETPIEQLRGLSATITTDAKEAINKVENELYEAFAELFPKVLNGEYRYLRLESDGFEPLSIEWIGENRISIMHTYTKNGDLMYDPMITFEIDQQKKTMTASEYENSDPPLYQHIDERGNGISVDGNGKQRTKLSLRTEINEFARQWFSNIEEQDYLPVRANLVIDGEETQITFSEDGKPILPQPEVLVNEAVEQKLYNLFEAMFPQFMSGEYRYLRLESANDKPLVLKWVSDDIITISHTYELDGEPAFEPLVALNVSETEKSLTARSFIVSEPPTHDVVYSESGTPDIAMQQQINGMTARWIELAGAHSFKPVEATIDVEGKAVTVTFDRDGNIVMPQSEKQYDIGYAHLGNGLTIWNRLEEKGGDYVTVAHIGPDRKITYYESNLPDGIKAQIEDIALTSDARVSVSQSEQRVFNTPPLGSGPEAITPEIELPITSPTPDEVDETETDIVFPDSSIGYAEMNLYGYAGADILPLTKDRAEELFDADLTIYLLHSDNTEAMVFDRNEILNHDGLFGIERRDWEALRQFNEMPAEPPEPKIYEEADLLNSEKDTFGIYQLKRGDETRDYRFESLERLETLGLSVDRENYELVYLSPLAEANTLDRLYEQFNINRPSDFMGHSMSVSDIIVMNRDGNISSHYVDRIGFSELPAFLGIETQKPQVVEESIPTVEELRAAAKAGKPISLTDLKRAMSAEREKAAIGKQPPSLMARLEDAKQNVAAPSVSDTQKRKEREV